MSSIMNAQAEWALQNNDWKTAASLFISSRNYKKAIDIYGKENYMDGLIEVCRMIDKADNEANLIACANMFRKNKNHGYAKETYLKLGDVKSLMSLHIEMERWEDVFLLGRQNK
jgi:intraflagellar transport protein 122